MAKCGISSHLDSVFFHYSYDSLILNSAGMCSGWSVKREC